MQIRDILLSSITILILSGCDSKHHFEPKNVDRDNSALNSGYEIKYFSRDGAVLEDGRVLTRSGSLNLKLEDGYRFINSGDYGVIVANRDGICKIIDGKSSKSINLKKELLAGAVIDNKLIYLLRDNSFGMYDLSQDKIVYYNKEERVYSIDARVANPIQTEELVIIPLLNGKITIINLKTKRITKEIFVSTEKSLNNIIFLKIVKNSLFVATQHKLISISKRRRELKENIAEVTIYNDDIFIFSKDGRVLRVDKNLTIQDEKKFKFARFSASTVYRDRVYMLDKQGYLIVSNKNFSKHKVYKFPEVDSLSFISNNRIYYGGNIINLERLKY